MKGLLKYIFNPLLFPTIFFAGFILYSFHWVDYLNNATLELAFYVSLSILLYLIGVFAGIFLVIKKYTGKALIEIRYTKNISQIIILIYLLCLILFFIEYLNFILKFGTIPLLSPQVEILRFEFPINGYIHLLAILNYPLIFILLIDLFKYSKFKSSVYKRSIYLLFGISCVFSLGMGGRGTIVIFLLYIFIAISFLKKISTVKIFMVAVIGLYFLGLLKLVRDYAFYGDTVLDDIAQHWIFGENQIMMPFYFSYLGIVMNFSVLDAYISQINEFFLGYFTILKPFMDLIPGKSYNMIDLQREVLNIHFHGTLTNTILGKPFIDFGYFGSIIMFFIGLIAGREFWLIVKYGLLRNILPYAFLYAQILMGIYTYTFGSFHILLYLLIIKIAGSYMDRKILQ